MNKNTINIKELYKVKGFTLIELIIAVSIVIITSVVIYRFAQNTNNNRKVNTEVEQLGELIKSIDNLSLASDYSVLSNASLPTYGVNFVSQFNTPPAIEGEPGKLTITYRNLNPQQCSAFSLKSLSKLSALSTYITTINNVEIIKDDPVEVAKDCQEDNNSVALIFTKSTNLTTNVAQSPPAVNPPNSNPVFPLPPPPPIMPPISSPPTVSTPVPINTIPSPPLPPPAVSPINKPPVSSPVFPIEGVTPVNPTTPPLPPVVEPVVRPPYVAPPRPPKPAPPPPPPAPVCVVVGYGAPYCYTVTVGWREVSFPTMTVCGQTNYYCEPIYNTQCRSDPIYECN
jgi:hypothetical protein